MKYALILFYSLVFLNAEESLYYKWTDQSGRSITAIYLFSENTELELWWNENLYNLDIETLSLESKLLAKILNENISENQVLANWTDTLNRSIKAKFIKLIGETLILQMDGDVFTLPMESLDLQSQKLAEELMDSLDYKEHTLVNLLKPHNYTESWFYNPNRGWMWTNRDAYPYFYDAIDKNWMYFQSGNDKPKFYRYKTKTWLTIE